MGDLFILVVSGDANFRDYLCNYLLMDGHYVDSATQSNTARQMLQRIQYDLVLLSISKFDQEDDVLTTEEIKGMNPATEVVFLFHPNCDIDKHCVTGKKMHHYLLKPLLLENLPTLLDRIEEEKSQRRGSQFPLHEERSIPKERRRYFRVLADIPIKYTFVSPLGNIPSEENVSKTVNMSQEGIMFRADFRAKLSEFVYLNILLPTSTTPLNIEGEIRWERFNSSEPWRYLGVCFSHVTQVNKKQIKSFIMSRQG
ncbi:MAG: PilZ domain-containing protein [bacterium]